MSELSPNGAEWVAPEEDVGHRAEGYLEEILRKYAELGVIDEVPQEEFGKKRDKPAFFRADWEIDLNEGWDFGFFNTKVWQKVDLTTMAKSERLDEKTERNNKDGIRTIDIPLHVLEKASRTNATFTDPNRYLKSVSDRIGDLVTPDPHA